MKFPLEPPENRSFPRAMLDYWRGNNPWFWGLKKPTGVHAEPQNGCPFRGDGLPQAGTPAWSFVEYHASIFDCYQLCCMGVASKIIAHASHGLIMKFSVVTWRTVQEPMFLTSSNISKKRRCWSPMLHLKAPKPRSCPVFFARNWASMLLVQLLMGLRYFAAARRMWK